MEIDHATSNITNTDDLREKIHEIHNYMRNNGIGYGLTSLKVFNLFYGLMRIEDYGLNEVIGLTDEKCKFSNLLKLVNDPNEKDFIGILNNQTINMIYDNDNVELLLGYNIPTDLKPDIYKYLLNEIKSIKDIEKSSKEQLSGKIYEYFVGRDQSAISELGAYFTNRRIVDFILNKIKPQLKSDGTIPKMIDMFGGSGGFTIGYMNYLIKNKFEIDWKTQLNNIYHFDINEDVLKSARLELFCLSRGIIPNMNDNVKRTNSFKQDFKNFGKFDLILTNPPYGGDKQGTSAKKEKRDKIIKYIDNEFIIFKKNIIEIIENSYNDDIKSKNKLLEDIKKPKTKIDKILKLIKDIEIFKDNKDVKRIQDLYNQHHQLKIDNKTEIEKNKKLCVNIDSCSDDIIKFAKKHKLSGSDKEACSLMLIMDLLEINGTAVGVLKEGLFFDGSYMELRKVLITEYNVKEIISIPSNQFENTSTKTSIVIFNNDGDIKTSYINFSELKVNLYDKDEFIEIINEYNELEIKLKYNKGDIKNIEEIFIKSVSIDEILNNETISLNSKDYNKVSIIPGEDFKLVKISDICEFHKYKSQKEDIDGIFNYYSCSSIIKKCNNPNINGEFILLGTRGTIIEALHYINGKFGCNNNMLIFNAKNNNIYIYYIIKIIKYLINTYITGSTIPMISKEKFQELEIPIPKTQDLFDYWIDKISTPFMKKQEKEGRFKELEEEIKMKIKDIQENHECDNVKFEDIFDIKTGKLNKRDININGKYPYYNASINNPFGKTDKLSFIGKKYIIMIRCGGNSKNRISNNHALGQVYLINKNIGANEGIYQLNIKSDIYNVNYLYYYLKSKTPYLQENAYYSTGIGNLHKEKLRNMEIKLPKDKSLIDNLQPLFDEVEELQKEIKELDETYNEYLQELSKSAIKNQEILNGISNEIIEDTEEVDEKEEDNKEKSSVDEETTSIKSNKSQTIQQLKEQCKSLGIKGYSKKKKEELIELIKNHK